MVGRFECDYSFFYFFLRSCKDKLSFALGFLNISSFCNFFPPASLPHLLPADVTLAIVIVAIYSPLVLLIGIPEALRDAEHLVWWGRFGFMFSIFFYFFLKGMRTT